MILYHVSYDVFQAERYVFKPRVPESRADRENDSIKRICFTDSIENCLRSISSDLQFMNEYNLIRVYKFEVSDQDENLMHWEELYRNNYAYDAALTHEYWYLNEVVLESKIYCIKDYSYDIFTIIPFDQKKLVIDTLKEFGIETNPIKNKCASDIFNFWLEENVQMFEIVQEKIKSKLTIFKTEDISNDKLFEQIFGHAPNFTCKINNYEPIKMIKNLKIEEVDDEFLMNHFLIKKCTFNELQCIISKKNLQLAWKLIDENYVWKKDAYLYVVRNMKNEIVSLIYFHIYNRESFVDFFEVLEGYRRKGYGKKIILKFLEEKVFKENVIIDVPISKEAEKFWESCGLYSME